MSPKGISFKSRSLQERNISMVWRKPDTFGLDDQLKTQQQVQINLVGRANTPNNIFTLISQRSDGDVRLFKNESPPDRPRGSNTPPKGDISRFLRTNVVPATSRVLMLEFAKPDSRRIQQSPFCTPAHKILNLREVKTGRQLG